MNDYGKFWLIFWGMLLATVCVIAVCITTYNVKLNKMYLDGRYEQQIVRENGCTWLIWKKIQN